ncbi:hypothetical protein ENSA5_52270 [Enhygromyxa salina]|uniref:Uncharacterized protein n=1 Tax=Enhygromyxa salina TaxID=215803 RepID=A0A2S9XG94_9BACT|nr:hypothetical protein [Enhygromyxa salina]PRP91885.1 hypothetical protein ENSA5_52270 [Enhygromyxa salina]
MTPTLALVTALAPEADRWADWRWLGTPDERVLWAILAAAALLALWGAWAGWRQER